MIRTRPDPERASAATSAWSEAKQGLSYVRKERWILIALLAATVSLLCTWGPWETLVPYVVPNDLEGSSLALGMVFGAGGVGSVMVALVFGQRGQLPRKPFTVLYLAWALGMLMTAGFGVVTEIWQATGRGPAHRRVDHRARHRLVHAAAAVGPQRTARAGGERRLVDLGRRGALSFAIVGPLSKAIGVDETLIMAGMRAPAVTIAFMFVRGARDPERDGRLEAPNVPPVDG